MSFTLLQQGIDTSTFQALGTGLRFGGSLVIALIVGAILLYATPDFLERTLRRARDETLRSFLWGLGVEILLLVVSVILAITVVGLIVAIPLLIVLAIVIYVGEVAVYIHLGRELLDYANVEASNTFVVLVVAAVVAAVVTTIPILGPIVAFVAGAIGFGAMLVNWRSD